MKLHLTTAALVIAAVPALAQSTMTGVSNPEPAIITTSDDTATTPKPSAAKPSAATPAPAGEVYGPYVPYTGPKSAGTTSVVAATEDTPVSNPDAQIVLTVPEREGELREGTVLRAQIRETLSTKTTVRGSRFTAEVVDPVEKGGRVIIPVGSVIEGQVTDVHGGRRITGAADLHLEPRSVTLPDGTHYVLHAQVIDTSKSELKVDGEGTLVRRGHGKETLAVISLATGGGAVAGAMIGGGVGAIVGASIGAGISTVVWLKEDRQATLQKDAQLVFSLTSPMILKPLSNGSMSSVTGSSVVGLAQ